MCFVFFRVEICHKHKVERTITSRQHKVIKIHKRFREAPSLVFDGLAANDSQLLYGKDVWLLF